MPILNEFFKKMHFRVRKNVIQLIRTKYDDREKRGVNTIVGTVRLVDPELSAELLGKLTAEEIAAFEDWSNTQHHIDMLREEMAALTLSDSIDLARKWFEREGGSAAAQTAAKNIASRWQVMRKLFTKNGLLD